MKTLFVTFTIAHIYDFALDLKPWPYCRSDKPQTNWSHLPACINICSPLGNTKVMHRGILVAPVTFSTPVSASAQDAGDPPGSAAIMQTQYLRCWLIDVHQMAKGNANNDVLIKPTAEMCFPGCYHKTQTLCDHRTLAEMLFKD